MSKKNTMLLVTTALLGASSSGARADRRGFTHTYEYMTMPEGDLELEFYNTQESYRLDTDSPTDFSSQVEVEYGITDHWDISVYQVFEGGDGGAGGVVEPLHYSETKFRTRYRLAERGQWPVDVLLYFEVIKPLGVLGVSLEPKLVLARDFGRTTVALNLIVELEAKEDATGTEVEYEPEPEFALGVTHELSPRWKVGGEAWGNLETFFETAEYGIWAGPAVSWAPSPKLWVTTTAGFKVLGAASDAMMGAEPDFSFRMILGLSL